MPRRYAASIGVDIDVSELRAVEVSIDGRSIKKFASASIASLNLDRGVPSDPTGFAEFLRNLFRDLAPSTKPAIFGIPPTAVTTRVLDVPQVPDNELRTILEGEVQHFGIVRGFGGMFDFLRLSKAAGQEDSAPQALVMACEALQLNSIRDAIERARLQRAAMEPSLLGLIRLAATRHQKPILGMVVALSGDFAEVALLHQDSLKLYRRFDLAPDTSEDSFLRGLTGEGVPAFLGGSKSANDSSALSIELKRTLDYAAREYKDLGAIEKIYLAVSHPSEAGVADQLSASLEMPVELATAPLPGDDGIRFAAAYGLAIANTLPGQGLPVFDLSPFDPIEEEHQQQRKILATSLIVSIAIVMAGIAGGLWFGRKANDLQHDLTHEQEELATLQTVQMPEAQERQGKLEQYRALSGFGIPVPQIVDSLASRLDEKSGIEEIEISGPSLKISGEAVDEASMIRTLDRIRTTPGFSNAFIESFDQNQDPARKFVKFQLSAQLGPSALPSGAKS